MRVRWLIPDPPNQRVHLCFETKTYKEPGGLQGTYCTRVWGTRVVDILRLNKSHGVPPNRYKTWLVVGDLIHEPGLRLFGYELEWCPDCLLLAKLEAEMRSQNQYPVVSLCKKLDENSKPVR